MSGESNISVVHKIKAVHGKEVETKCGLRHNGIQGFASVWENEVTCMNCRIPPIRNIKTELV